MPLSHSIGFLVAWTVMGAALFSVFVFVMFRSGLVYLARKPDGTLKDEIPLSGRLVMLASLALFTGFFLSANYFELVRPGYDLSFGELFVLNFLLYGLLFAYDTIVIDWLVLGRWRPAFLRVPASMGAESMRVHIIKSLPVGLLFGAALALLLAACSRYLLSA